MPSKTPTLRDIESLFSCALDDLETGAEELDADISQAHEALVSARDLLEHYWRVTADLPACDKERELIRVTLLSIDDALALTVFAGAAAEIPAALRARAL